MTKQHKQCLAIDIGGTSAKYAIIDSRGGIRKKDSFPTGHDTTRDIFMDSMYRVQDEALAAGIDGIGICSLGFVNSHTGHISGGVENLPFLNEMNLPALLGAHCRGTELPVYIQNDVKAAALGEQWVGAGQNCDNFFCITLGTGIGGALVLNGKVVDGAHFRAGEIAYLQYRDEQNYLEKSVSAKFLVEQAGKELNMPNMDGFRFFNLYREGNSVCAAILEEWLQRIGRCIADLIITLDIEKVIVGGGISHEDTILIPRLRKAVKGMLPKAFGDDCAVVAAQCANDAGVLGAASLVFRAQQSGISEN